MAVRLRGHAEARIDEKGRLKMPSMFKKTLDGSYGSSLFVTVDALSNDYLQIYPLPIWEELEIRVERLGLTHPARRKFLTRANRYGLEVEMDKQGRIPLKNVQRSLVSIREEVILIGCMDHLQLWPVEKLEAGDDPGSLSKEDFAALEF